MIGSLAGMVCVLGGGNRVGNTILDSINLFVFSLVSFKKLRRTIYSTVSTKS